MRARVGAAHFRHPSNHNKRDRPAWSARHVRIQAICLAFLTKATNALTLRQIHTLLHRAGYAIHHHHPVKALADALGHEADHGRATRTARGTYTATPTASTSTIPDF